jgi:outer membrane protein assembly factor BamB
MTRAAKRPIVLGLAAALAVAACTPLPDQVDPMAAAVREPLGRAVLELRWKRPIVDRTDEHRPQEFAAPAVYYDRIFVGSRGGWLYALSAGDGSVLWRRRVGAQSSQPVVDRGRIYLGTDDGTLLCLDTEDGAEHWRYGTRGAILRAPVLTEELVFFANDLDQVYALDRESGAYRWQHKGQTPEEYTLQGHAGIAVKDDLLFAGFADGTVIALRAATGSVAWMTSLRGKSERFADVDGIPTVHGDTLYVASSAGGVFALDRTTGLIRWRMDVAGAGTVVEDDGRLYFAAADVGVFAASAEGHIVWRQGIRGGGQPADPIVAGAYLIYALSEDGVFVADKRSGVVHQYFDPGYGISAAPAIQGDMMYVLSNSGILYALRMD